MFDDLKPILQRAAGSWRRTGRGCRSISLLVLVGLALPGCSVSNRQLGYEQAESMPGLGYVEYDLSQIHDQALLARRTLEYRIMYRKKEGGGVRFVSVVDTPLSHGRFKAYVPYYAGYEFRSVTWSQRFECSYRCYFNDSSILHFVEINSTTAVGGAWCSAVEHRNLERFDVTDDSCPGDVGGNGAKRFMGSVFITPHFAPGYPGTFTSRPRPGHSSAGS